MRFTVRRPPTGEVSPCCHRPPGGDVACSVDIGVAPASSAGFAFENRLALAVSGCDVPAGGATLRRIRGRHLIDPTRSLVLQTRGQKPPTALADRPIQPALLSNPRTRPFNGASRSAGHCPHVKCFDPDRVEAASNVSGDLFDPILAPVRLTGSQLRDRLFCSCPPVGAALGPREPPLQHLQPLSLTAGQNGCMQQFARRQRRRNRNTTVDAHHTSIMRPRDRVGDVGERDMPAAGPITGYPVGLDPRWHCSRQPKPHPAHLGHPHPPKVAVESLDVMRFDRDLPKPFVHVGFAPRRATMRTGKEVLHGLREIPQRLLLHRLTPGAKPHVLGADLGQLRGMLGIAGRLAAGSPMLLLLHSQIPHKPRIPAVRQQALLLSRGGHQPKPRHTRTLSTTTDIPTRHDSLTLGIGFLPTHARAFRTKETR